MMSGALGARSFAPLVRLCASYLALNLIFAGILELKQKMLAPTVIRYDYNCLMTIKFSLV